MQEQNQKNKIGLMLGSFNPPHIGHLYAAFQALNSVDKVWMVLAWQNPCKKPYEVGFMERGDMLTQMLEDSLFNNETYDIDWTDIEGWAEPTYTYELLEFIQKKFPENEYSIIGGTDVVEQIKNWKKGDWILENFKVIKVDRSIINCSSSQIREKIKNKETILPFVTRSVDAYIKKYNLYKDDKINSRH